MIILNRVVLRKQKPFLRNENRFRLIRQIGPFDLDNRVTHLKRPSVHHSLYRLARIQSSHLVSNVRQSLPQIVLQKKLKPNEENLTSISGLSLFI
jgi:hypothetical protein